MGSGQDADAEQHTEQQTRDIASIDIKRNRFVGLSRENASFEEALDLAELFGDHGATFGMVRRDLERRVHQKAAFTLTILDRVLDDLGKEPVERLRRRKRFLKPVQPIARRAIEVSLERARKQRLLVAKGIVKNSAPSNPSTP